MLESARMNELMARADVVLVNNKIFGKKCMYDFAFSLPFKKNLTDLLMCPAPNSGPGLIVNEAIQPKFLDLKEGALVISLELFVVGTAGGGCALTERNLDDISAILDVSAYDYHSWTSLGLRAQASFTCTASIVLATPTYVHNPKCQACQGLQSALV